MNRPHSLLRLAPIGLAVSLSACAVGPDYKPPALASLAVPQRFVAAAPLPASEAELAGWWEAFGDPVLTDLVTRALAANPSVEVAGARLRQARAALASSESSFWPSLGASGSGSRSETLRGGGSITDPTTGAVFNRSSGGQSSFRAGLDASYEVDLFGGIRRSVEAARADEGAAVADLHTAQLSVASDTAINYIAARTAQSRLAIARANLGYQDETVEIVGWRVRAGLVSSLDLEQARALRAQTAASIPALETNYTAAVNRIAILLGQAPGSVTALIDPIKPIPLPPEMIATGLPAELLQRRPDLVSAERALAAASARIGVATAELYPALRLSGSLTGSGSSFTGVADSVIGTLLGSISAPIFQGGALRAQIESARGGAGVAFGNYRSAVLTALEDVENALTSNTNARRRESQLLLAEQAANNATLFARSQYRAGLIDFQQLLEAERSLLSSQDSRATARADRATASVQLYRALGGGWQAAPEPQTVSGGRD
ncbi:MAG: efflux system outer rane lipoprotein [Sphingomonas bacterium]|nr:efflux system outer rane lipoprotein [Sphingomonas bacterium]